MSSRSGAATCVAVVLALVSATAFVVHARLDLDSTRHALRVSQQNLTQLAHDIRDASNQRADAAGALTKARDALAADTSARDRLRTTDQVEYDKLTGALGDLARHQAAIASDTSRAQRLDDCLLAASQVLNEAAVGDTAHLEQTLPSAQQRCAEAAA